MRLGSGTCGRWKSKRSRGRAVVNGRTEVDNGMEGLRGYVAVDMTRYGSEVERSGPWNDLVYPHSYHIRRYEVDVVILGACYGLLNFTRA